MSLSKTSIGISRRGGTTVSVSPICAALANWYPQCLTQVVLMAALVLGVEAVDMGRAKGQATPYTVRLTKAGHVEEKNEPDIAEDDEVDAFDFIL